MYKAVICIIAVFLCTEVYGVIGKLTEVTGPTQIVRSNNKIDGKVDTGVEMEDSIETLKSRVGITFEDNTRMQITEFSKLRIDEFVYDPATKTGSLSVKATAGTIRYASGLIAKNSRESVKVTTPTASVSVRGTDFSMTVAEDGKSLIVLLPSIPLTGGGPSIVGTIVVSNAAGSVILNQAYQATLVSSSQALPSIPVILDFQDESKINNMLIVNTPRSVIQSAKDTKKNNERQVVRDDGSTAKKETKKADNKIQVVQVDSINDATPVAMPIESDTNKQAKQNISNTETSAILNINALNPQVLNDIISALANAGTKITASDALILASSSSANTGFVSDNVAAILTVAKGSSIIRFTTRSDTSVVVTVTSTDGTVSYPLNFSDKLKVNIIQK